MTATDGRRAAIITGGATGIGRGITEVLSATGIDCVIAGRRTDVLEQAARELAQAPGTVEAIAADVTVPEQRQALIDRTLERFGRIDILVNNAGGGIHAPLLDWTPAEWRQVVDVNLDSAFFLAQGVLPLMRERGFGRIVGISSIMGSMGGDGTPTPHGMTDGERGPVRAPAYHASKAALTNLTRDLAAAVARWGVTVNSVSPGFIERPEHPRPAQVLEQIARRVPAGRTGEPRDIGHAVRYLVSDEAGYVTGVNLVVDGGRSAW